jgi:hypothetical protein
MNDIEKMPSTTNLSKLGVKAVVYTATGIFLLLLNLISSGDVFGFVFGGLVLLFGICFLRSKDPADKKAGLILTAAGALTVLSKMGITTVSHVSGVLLGIGAVGLLAFGAWNGIKFILGLKKRS